MRFLSIFGLIVSLSFLVACEKETPINDTNEDGQSNEIANCTFVQPNDIGALDNSVDQVIYNIQTAETYTYLTSDGENWEYTNAPLEKEEYQCLHTWICEEDENEAKTYWVGREFAKTTLSTNQNGIVFGFDTYATFDEHDTKKYSDYVTINIIEPSNDSGGGNEFDNTVCCVMEFLLDKRTNPTANNDELEFESSLTLNNTIFENVYVASKENYTVYFNLDLGLIGYKTVDTDFTASRVL